MFDFHWRRSSVLHRLLKKLSTHSSSRYHDRFELADFKVKDSRFWHIRLRRDCWQEERSAVYERRYEEFLLNGEGCQEIEPNAGTWRFYWSLSEQRILQHTLAQHQPEHSHHLHVDIDCLHPLHEVSILLQASPNGIDLAIVFRGFDQHANRRWEWEHDQQIRKATSHDDVIAMNIKLFLLVCQQNSHPSIFAVKSFPLISNISETQ